MNAAAMRMLTDEELLQRAFAQTELEQELLDRLNATQERDNIEIERLEAALDQGERRMGRLEDEICDKETELEDVETKVHDLRDRLISSVRLSSDSLRLALGEMTTQELRTANAVLAMIGRRVADEFKASGFG